MTKCGRATAQMPSSGLPRTEMTSAHCIRASGPQSRSVPQGRLMELREIAVFARYLASDEAAAIAGQAINVSAGLVTH